VEGILVVPVAFSGCFSEKATIGISCLCCFQVALIEGKSNLRKQHRQLMPMVAFSEKQPEATLESNNKIKSNLRKQHRQLLPATRSNHGKMTQKGKKSKM
jgi:hypothetical protein